MATTLTRNLKLRIDSNLTANAKYNLERIDDLGSTFLVDTASNLNIRSKTDITIEPESADIGGSGTGGSVSIGTPSHPLASLNLYAPSLDLSSKIGLLDQAVGGTNYLRLQYLSTIHGLVDTANDRTLSIDVDGADRNLVLGGDLSVLGGSLTLNLSGSSTLTLPLTGVLSTLAGSETLTNKSIDGSSNVITGLTNSAISSSAGITYNKLSLTGGIVNSDISASAGIQVSKLAPGAEGDVLQVISGVAAWGPAGGGGGGAVNSYTGTWVNADGTSKTITHNLGSNAVEVSIIDLDDDTIIQVDSIVVSSSNAISLSASEAPNSSWRVVVHA